MAWRSTVSYTWAEDETFDEPVLGIAPLSGELGARVFALGGRLWIDAELELVDRQERVATSRFEQETPGYSLVNLAAELELGKQWRLQAGIDNLDDRAYARHLSTPNPFTGERILEVGRNVRLGLRLEL